MELKELQNKLEYYEKEINDNEKIKNNIEGKLEIIIDSLKKEFNIDINKIDDFLNEKNYNLKLLEKEIENNLIELEKYV